MGEREKRRLASPILRFSHSLIHNIDHSQMSGERTRV